MPSLLDLLPPELRARFTYDQRTSPRSSSDNVGQTMAASSAMSGAPTGGPPSLAAMSGGRPAVWGDPGQLGGPDMQVTSQRLGSARSIGSPTYEQILAGLRTSGSPEGTKAAEEYADRLYKEYYLPGGATDLSEAGQGYVRANDIDYGGGPLEAPGGGGPSGFTFGGVDPFADQETVAGVPRANLGTHINQLPWQQRNMYGPAVVRYVQTQAPSRGVGTLYPGSVSFAPINTHPSAPPQGEGQWLGNQMRDAWGRLIGASGQGYNIS